MAEESSVASTATGTDAVWFDPKKFQAAEFDAEQYVADLRRFVPLENLSTQLESHLTVLKQKLVEVINENYNEFVSLGSQLSGVEGAVVRIRKPLEELKAGLDGIQGRIHKEFSNLHKALERRKEIAFVREKLELMQDAVHLAAKVEKLVEELKGVEASGDLGSRSSLLERVAGEVGKLHLLMAQGKELPFIQGIEKKMEPVQGELRKHLVSCLTSALVEGNEAASLHLLHAFSMIGECASGEQVVRATLVKPLVEEAIQNAKKNQEAKKGSGGVELSTVTLPLLKLLRKKCGSLFDKVLAFDSGLHVFNLLGNSVVSELHLQLAENLHGAFLAGVPSLFMSNYKSAVAFLDGLESYCRILSDIEALRNSDSVGAFLRRWNLQVYYSLRFQEIAGSVDKALQKDEFGVSENSELNLTTSNEWWDGFSLCLSDEVFLSQLSDAFLKLALQIIARYVTWMDVGLQSLKNKDESSPGCFPAATEDLALLIVDLSTLHSRLSTAVPDRLRELMGFLPNDVINGLINAIQSISGPFETHQDEFLAIIVENLALKSNEVLKKRVQAAAVTMFGNASQTSPKQPNDYVKSIVDPLVNFLNHPKVKDLSPISRKIVTSRFADQTCGTYKQSLDGLLTFVQKSRLSLQRINKGRMSDSGDGGDANRSDLDNVLQQHLLDVQELGRLLKNEGVEIDELDSYKKLFELVAPKEK